MDSTQENKLEKLTLRKTKKTHSTSEEKEPAGKAHTSLTAEDNTQKESNAASPPNAARRKHDGWELRCCLLLPCQRNAPDQECGYLPRQRKTKSKHRSTAVISSQLSHSLFKVQTSKAYPRFSSHACRLELHSPHYKTSLAYMTMKWNRHHG